MILFIGCSTVHQCDIRCKWFCLSVALFCLSATLQYINVIFAANDSVCRLLYCTSMWYSLQMILFIGCSIVHQCNFHCKWFCLSVAQLYINVIFAANDSVYRLLYCTSMWYSLQMILFISYSTVHQCDIRCKWFCFSVALLYINVIFAANDSVYRLLYCTSMWFSLQMILFIGWSTVHQCDIRCKWFCLSVALLYINVIFTANDSVYLLLNCTSMWFTLQMILFIGWSTVHQCDIRGKWFCLSVALLDINVIFAANDSVYRLLYCTSM